MFGRGGCWKPWGPAASCWALVVTWAEAARSWRATVVCWAADVLRWALAVSNWAAVVVRPAVAALCQAGAARIWAVARWQWLQWLPLPAWTTPLLWDDHTNKPTGGQ